MTTINDKTYSASEHEPKTVAELLYQMQLRLEQAIIMGGYNPRGNYDPTATYKLKDAVVYNGNGYVHYTDKEIIGVVPTNEEEWKLYVSGVAGETGPEGPQGPKGDTGPQGPQGLQGVKGDTGARGPQGIQGETGPQGVQGLQGIAGPQGPAGTVGPQGPQGPQGVKGDTGETGPTGPEGPQGIQGLQGVSGNTGARGPEGPQGIQGPKGDKGDKGENGTGLTIISTLATVADLEPLKPTAKAGDAYAVGIAPPRDIYLFSENISEFVNQGPIQGPQGPEGPQGPQGIQGLVGPTGTQGEQGPQGIQGEKGATGATGPVGPKGDQGLQGPQGEIGPAGPKGETGPQGPAGAKGDKGETGPQGPQGVKGDTGAQGIQGTAGAKGDTGPQGPTGAAGKDGVGFYYTTDNTTGTTPVSTLLSQIMPSGIKVNDFLVNTQGKVCQVTSINGNTVSTGYRTSIKGAKGDKGDTGATGPAGPATLPNYVSFEKPTSTDVSMNGAEVTYTGVAKWEAAGAMESGEFHEVKESPLLFISMGSTGNASTGNYFNFSTANFNRTPHIREKCFFITRQSIDNSVVAWTGMCTEIAGSTARFQVLIVQNISGQKYQHNICMKIDGAYAISFQVVSDVARKYVTISQLKDLFSELIDYPASGLVLVGTTYKNVYSIKKVTNIMYIQPWEGASNAAYTLADTAIITQDTVVKL
jgi:hypothetical protein